MKTPKERMEDIATDHDLVENTKTALEYDRSIGRVGSVDVTADDGVVIIAGTVYSHAQKAAVERAVRRRRCGSLGCRCERDRQPHRRRGQKHSSLTAAVSPA